MKHKRALTKASHDAYGHPNAARVAGLGESGGSGSGNQSERLHAPSRRRACAKRAHGENFAGTRSMNPDLVEIVQAAGVALRRQGKEFTGLCPFHADKHPSFAVNPDKQVWFCHACSEGGDPFALSKNFMASCSRRRWRFSESTEGRGRRARWRSMQRRENSQAG